MPCLSPLRFPTTTQLIELKLTKHPKKIADLNIPIEEAPPPPQDPSDTPADDRIAEEFKREFLDAIASRRQKRRAAKPPARPGDRRAGDGDVLKGPKLGGSRNVRSAVRDILLQQEKEREKEKAKGRMRR